MKSCDVLALDLSLNSTGFAIFSDDKTLVTYGVIDNKTLKSREEKMRRIFSFLDDLTIKYKIDTLVIEDTFLGFNVGTLKTLCRLAGIAIAISAKNNTNIEFISNQTVKRSTGIKLSSNTKEAMRRKAIKDFDLDPTITNDISDAIFLGLCFLKEETE